HNITFYDDDYENMESDLRAPPVLPRQEKGKKQKKDKTLEGLPESEELKAKWWLLISLVGLLFFMFLTLAMLTVLMYIQWAFCGSCPHGWKSIGRSCYYISTDKATWENALFNCIGLKSLLLILSSKEEMDQLKRFCVSGRTYWIGLKRDNKNSDEWKWVDGTPMTFSNWQDGDPNNAGNHEDCVETFGHWNDLHCETNLLFICKRTLNC
ncbi:hypothetical protein GDO86_006837, partial [Hymenochirus boettgeri]